MNVDTRALKTRIREEYARVASREGELRKELEELGSEKLRLQEWEANVEDFENLLSQIESKIEINSLHSFDAKANLPEGDNRPTPHSIVSLENSDLASDGRQQTGAPEHSVTTHSGSNVVNHWG